MLPSLTKVSTLDVVVETKVFYEGDVELLDRVNMVDQYVEILASVFIFPIHNRLLAIS
jgi:hypothetical protein